MPTEDAIRFIYKDFVNKTKGISPNRSYQHPEAISTLLKNLFENRSLTVLQYDHIIKYLSQRKEAQVVAEIGEDAHETNMDTTPAANSTNSERPMTAAELSASSSSTFTTMAQDRANELQKKILGMLKNKSITEKIAQNVEKKAKLTQSDKDDLKLKVLKDEKVKSALSALLGRK